MRKETTCEERREDSESLGGEGFSWNARPDLWELLARELIVPAKVGEALFAVWDDHSAERGKLLNHSLADVCCWRSVKSEAVDSDLGDLHGTDLLLGSSVDAGLVEQLLVAD